MKPIVKKAFSSKNSAITSAGRTSLSSGVIQAINKYGTPPKNLSSGITLDKNIPDYTSYPSRVIYAVDAPEISDYNIEFVYNFFTPDESIKDIDTLTDEVVSKMNLSQNIISKNRFEFTEEELSINRSKLPRYVKIQFRPPLSERIKYGTSQQSSVISENFDKIVKEENFSSMFFSNLAFNNRSLDAQTNAIMNATGLFDFEESSPVSDPTIRQVMSQQDLIENTIYRNGQGKTIANNYFNSIKKLSTTIQINSALLDDLVKTASGNPLTPNFQNFKTFSNESGKLRDSFNDYRLTDSDYETSINYYKIVATTDSTSNPTNSVLLGYWIEKMELLPDGTKKKFDPIIIESATANSYIDFDVRYGTTYVYETRSIVEVSYAAVDNRTYDINMISSLIASRGKLDYVETTENVGPPPPVELKAIWDFDKINPDTMEYDSYNNAPYPNTGKYGSLYLTWGFPINSQMDIKKFQVFRRSSLEEPFELIKMFDFDDSVIRFPLLEEQIDTNVISYSQDPKKSYYDYDFMKNSRYIYAVCAIDAHGLSSNYSEQIAVTFDEYSNKLITETVSLAGAPKQYPNLYLEEDLFVDTMRTSDKRHLHVYFSPDCYQICNNEGQITNIVGTQKNETSYVMNFINIENQNSARIDLNVVDNRPPFVPTKKAKSSEEKNNTSNSIKNSLSFLKQAISKKKYKKYKKIKNFP